MTIMKISATHLKHSKQSEDENLHKHARYMCSILEPVPLFPCWHARLDELIVHIDQVVHQTVCALSRSIRPRYNHFQRLIVRKHSVSAVARNLYITCTEDELNWQSSLLIYM